MHSKISISEKQFILTKFKFFVSRFQHPQYGYKVHKANSRKVKNFIRSFGTYAKTDALDAKALAKYGCDRHAELDLYLQLPKERMALFHLVQRRKDLKAFLIAEKNRSKSPDNDILVAINIQESIAFINNQIGAIDKAINQIIDASENLKLQHTELMKIPGVGNIVAFELLALLPELGTLSRRKIASLVGLAPIAKDSGKYKGYRRTGHGRQGIKPCIFMAAMAACRSKSNIGEFHDRLAAKGKPKIVVLTATMRKIVVIANAKIRDIAIANQI